jgi:hypothetical protein
MDYAPLEIAGSMIRLFRVFLSPLTLFLSPLKKQAENCGFELSPLIVTFEIRLSPSTLDCHLQSYGCLQPRFRISPFRHLSAEAIGIAHNNVAFVALNLDRIILNGEWTSFDTQRRRRLSFIMRNACVMTKDDEANNSATAFHV